MKKTPKDDDGNPLENALGAIKRTPQQEELHKAAPDVPDAKALSDLRALVHGDFARLDTSTKKEKVVAPERKKELLETLEARFVEKSKRFCNDIKFLDLRRALDGASEIQWYGLDMMEKNGHEGQRSHFWAFFLNF